MKYEQQNGVPIAHVSKNADTQLNKQGKGRLKWPIVRQLSDMKQLIDEYLQEINTSPLDCQFDIH